MRTTAGILASANLSSTAVTLISYSLRISGLSSKRISPESKSNGVLRIQQRSLDDSIIRREFLDNITRTRIMRNCQRAFSTNPCISGSKDQKERGKFYFYHTIIIARSRSTISHTDYRQKERTTKPKPKEGYCSLAQAQRIDRQPLEASIFLPSSQKNGARIGTQICVFPVLSPTNELGILGMESQESQKSKLFNYLPIEDKDDIEERLERCYSMFKSIPSGPMRDTKSHDALISYATKSPDQHEALCVALLYAMLTDPQSAHKTFRDLTVVNQDGFGCFLSNLNNLVIRKFSICLEDVRNQFVWLLGELLRNAVHGAEQYCNNLLRQIIGGDTSPKNITFCTGMIDLLTSCRLYVDKIRSLVPMVVYTFLRLMEDHGDHPQLQTREAELVTSLIREHMMDCLQIGRDLVRLMHQVARLPLITELWKDILTSPQSLHPSFQGVHQLLSTRTSRRMLQSRLTPEMEEKIVFLASAVRLGNHRRYQEWFEKTYLNTDASQTLRSDLVRFIVNVIHPTNEMLSSDITPRWALMGWLITGCPNPVATQNCKLALFYDWLYYDPERDNIMNIEPAILLINFSLKTHPMLAASLLDFLCRVRFNLCIRQFVTLCAMHLFYLDQLTSPCSRVLVLFSFVFRFVCDFQTATQYCAFLSDAFLVGIKNSFHDIVHKKVLASLSPVLESPKLDKELHALLARNFPEFCDLTVSSAATPLTPLAPHNPPPVASRPPVSKSPALDAPHHRTLHVEEKKPEIKQVSQVNENPSSAVNSEEVKVEKVPGTGSTSSGPAPPVFAPGDPRAPRKISPPPVQEIQKEEMQEIPLMDPVVRLERLHTNEEERAEVNNKGNTNNMKTEGVDSLGIVCYKNKHGVSLSDFIHPIKPIAPDKPNGTIAALPKRIRELMNQVLEERPKDELLVDIAASLCAVLAPSFTGRLLPVHSTDAPSLEESTSKPLYALFCYLTQIPDGDKNRETLLQLTAEMYAVERALGYRLLFYLETKGRTPDHALVYRGLCDALDCDLKVQLRQDLELCLRDDVSLFFWLLPSVFGLFPTATYSNQHLMRLIMDACDADRICQLLQAVSREEVTFFRKDSLYPVLKDSLEWETWSQSCVWKLATIHPFQCPPFLCVMPHLSEDGHPEAKAAILGLLREEPPRIEVVKAVFTLPLSKPDPFTGAIFNPWIKEESEELTKSLLSLLQPGSGSTPRKRKRGKGSSLDVSSFLMHLESIRVYSKRCASILLNPQIRKALTAVEKGLAETQQEKFSEFFRYIREDKKGKSSSSANPGTGGRSGGSSNRSYSRSVSPAQTAKGDRASDSSGNEDDAGSGAEDSESSEDCVVNTRRPSHKKRRTEIQSSDSD
ncbi:unnamed protein product [Cyprideis torosa]|uniref:SOSS complex subunit A homolog n=1 Tax=Cyprideis torosa TaxID=163714 RepID=A0A7R8W2V8_9CRUS|nr:unnamed protein product [Cyprideis torosa]CAG0882381.1 unnamed protein product [Cyprideis torosa]